MVESIEKVTWDTFCHKTRERLFVAQGYHYSSGRNNLTGKEIEIIHLMNSEFRGFCEKLLNNELEVILPPGKYSSYQDFIRKVNYTYIKSDFDWSKEDKFNYFMNIFSDNFKHSKSKI